MLLNSVSVSVTMRGNPSERDWSTVRTAIFYDFNKSYMAASDWYGTQALVLIDFYRS